MRGFNDNFAGYTNDAGINGYRANFMDNLDAVALLLPYEGDGVKITPYFMFAGIGPNVFRTGSPYNWAKDKDGSFAPDPDTRWSFTGEAGIMPYMGLFPVGGALHSDGSSANKQAWRKMNQYGSAWWGGISADFKNWDPFHFAFDFTYGEVRWQDVGRLNRSGWFGTILAEYNLDWGVPGIFGWYSSGDDSNPANGSERLPILDANDSYNFYSSYAWIGGLPITRACTLNPAGMEGTWGIGARLRNLSLIEDLKTIVHVNFLGGTNSTTMAKKISLNGRWFNGSAFDDSTNPVMNGIGMGGTYLTTGDHALDIGMVNTYKIYENLSFWLQADYIAMWLDTSTSAWGARHTEGKSIPGVKDAWNINMAFMYTF